jgi:hypothetical protein
MLPRLIAFGAGLLVLLFLLKVIHTLSEAIAGRSVSLFGMTIECVLIAALLVAYPEWVRLFPRIFSSIGHGIQSTAGADLNGQMAGALAQMGDERASDFHLWSAQGVELGIASLMAALSSTIALVLLWAVAKLQAYLFTFWYLLGPIALPTLIYRPLRHVGRTWLGTLLGVSFMSVTGPLLYAILARSQWLAHAFAAGGELDPLTCLVFSLLVILAMFLIPALSIRVWGGIEDKVIRSIRPAAEGAGEAAAVFRNAAVRARAAYQNWRGGGAQSRRSGEGGG